jgi:dephospho-CoA kinase
MRIPRKGAGQEWLCLGLKEFGVLGAYADGQVSHDELDAITSALVGTFHWIGLSEGLGSPEEPPLMIPRLDGKGHRLIVGISGPIAAGKTTLAEALATKGFAYTRFSLVIDDELNRRGQPLDRQHRQALGAELHAEGRQRWLSERTLERVGGATLIVVDGLRFPEDHAFLAERAGANFLHVFVDADESKRRERYAVRANDGSFDTAAGADVEAQVEAMRRLADEIFMNNGAKAEIQQYVDELTHNLNGEKSCLSRS